MSLWAIVPVKPLRRGKSRLREVLSEEKRALLNYSMLDKTLLTLSEVPEIDKILVVSRDPAALALARERGTRTLMEDGSPELNIALRRASAVAKTYNAHAIVIIPADLPLLSLDDLKSFLQHSGNPPEMIISPDRRWDGTNALYLNPIGSIEYAYGEGSLYKHINQARDKNLHVEVFPLATIGFDLDLPEDLEMLRQIENDQLSQVIKYNISL